jgi:hypothetical protein
MTQTGNTTTTATSVETTQTSHREKVQNSRQKEEARGRNVLKKAKGSPRIIKYPGNLGTSEQPHSINFYISQFVPGADGEKVRQANAKSNSFGIPSARIGNEITFENADSIEKANSTITNVAGTIVGATAGGSLGGGGLTGLVAKIAGALAGGNITDHLSQDATSIKTTPAIRMREVISLHIPQSPQAKYGAVFENESIGTVLGVLATGGGDVQALMDAAAGGTGQEIISRALMDAASLPKAAGLGFNPGGLARAASKKVRNPFQEQIFKTMNFRSFAFQYKFAPRNLKEFQNVQEIIKLFKYHMHPEKSPDGAFFTFPSVFDIEYRYKNDRNQFVNKIATSVLTDLSVDYGSEGVFTTFRDTDGAPSEITMAMQFREIVLLSKDPNSDDLTDGAGVRGY